MFRLAPPLALGAIACVLAASPAQAMSDQELFQRLVLAEAYGEGELGMALVARSVLNRMAMLQSGTVSPGYYLAKGSSLRHVILASRQYEPVSNGAINKSFTSAQFAAAARAISMAQDSLALQRALLAKGHTASEAEKLLEATGFRTPTAFNDSSQNYNRVRIGNHIFNGDKKSVQTDVSALFQQHFGGGLPISNSPGGAIPSSSGATSGASPSLTSGGAQRPSAFSGAGNNTISLGTNGRSPYTAKAGFRFPGATSQGAAPQSTQLSGGGNGTNEMLQLLIKIASQVAQLETLSTSDDPNTLKQALQQAGPLLQALQSVAGVQAPDASSMDFAGIARNQQLRAGAERLRDRVRAGAARAAAPASTDPQERQQALDAALGGDTNGIDFENTGGALASADGGRVEFNGKTVSSRMVTDVLARISVAAGGKVISVTSGDRNHVPRGGSRTSLHLHRRAADFYIQGMSLSAGYQLLKSKFSEIFPAGHGFEVIYHGPSTVTGGPHLHVGHRTSTQMKWIRENGSYQRDSGPQHGQQ